MKLSIIIPCYNEEKTIEEIIRRIHKYSKITNKEIIVIDDGSNDRTKLILRSTTYKIDKIIFHKKNLGKGAAIKTGLKYVSGKIIIIQDADLEYHPKDYKKLIKPILSKNYLVVYGSRVLNLKNRYLVNKGFYSLSRIFFNHILTIFSNLINFQNLTDAHTCYKVFYKDIFQKIILEHDDFSFCPEITTKLSNNKIKIKEIGIYYKGRNFNEGKKISFIDGFIALYTIIKFKLKRW